VTREVTSSVFHVEYDDGEAHDENLRNDRFKWHGPRASIAAEPYHAGMRPAMLELGAVNAQVEEIEVASTLTSHNVRPMPVWVDDADLSQPLFVAQVSSPHSGYMSQLHAFQGITVICDHRLGLHAFSLLL
jgi:hypothetical protein